MERRKFLKIAATGAAVAGVAAACGPNPTVAPTAVAGPTLAPTAQTSSLPSLSWQMATSWPVSLDTIFGGAQYFAERVAALTEGKFKITPRAGGELAPATQVLDVVQSGAVEMGHSASYYYVGKSNVCGIATSLPFGFTAQQQNAWLYEGGGSKKLQDFFLKKFGVVQFPAGNTGTQMGGWFRKALTSVNDLKGLKMRIPGLGGQVMTKLGVTVQVLAGGEIFQALQTGAVDAAEWVGPYDDEKLGLYKAAQFYHYPGWWEPGPTLDIYVNKAKWDTLPPFYQQVVQSCAAEANMQMLSRYEARNNDKLKFLLAQGVKLVPFPRDLLEAAQKAAFELYDGYAAADPDFKAIYEDWKVFRKSIYAWNSTNEAAYSAFVFDTNK